MTISTWKMTAILGATMTRLPCRAWQAFLVVLASTSMTSCKAGLSVNSTRNATASKKITSAGGGEESREAIPVIIDKTIELSSSDANSIVVKWSEAVNPLGGSDALEYSVYHSKVDNIADADAAEAHGTKVGTYKGPLTSIVVSDLEAGQTYYVVVVVKNGAGGKNAYAMTKVVVKGAPAPEKLALVQPLPVRAGQTQELKVTGGVPPYRFSLVSGTGDVDALSGVYSASFAPSVDEVKVTDAKGAEATVRVVVYAPMVTNGAHSCALFEDGRIKCFGGESFGALGNGSTTNMIGSGPNQMGNDLPHVNLGTGLKARFIAAARDSTCAIVQDGRVKCWGYNGLGELGVGDKTNRGELLSQMGDALPFVDLGKDRTALALFAGYHFMCAVLDNDALKCWGENTNGQLGLGDASHRGDDPGEMGDNLPTVNLGKGRRVVQMHGGLGTACALLDDKSVKCWGNGTIGTAPGQMGDALPSLTFGAGTKVKSLIGYGTRNDIYAVLLENGVIKEFSGIGSTAAGWGDSLSPIDLGTGKSAKTLWSSWYTRCAKLNDDTVRCWGWNSSDAALGEGTGQLIGTNQVRGDEPGEMGDNMPPLSLGTGLVPSYMSGGCWYMCAYFNAKQMKCWGDAGRIGSGHNNDVGNAPGQMGDDLPLIDFGG